jgi:hypothetical protein
MFHKPTLFVARKYYEEILEIIHRQIHIEEFDLHMLEISGTKILIL